MRHVVHVIVGHNRIIVDTQRVHCGHITQHALAQSVQVVVNDGVVVRVGRVGPIPIPAYDAPHNITGVCKVRRERAKGGTKVMRT